VDCRRRVAAHAQPRGSIEVGTLVGPGRDCPPIYRMKRKPRPVIIGPRSRGETHLTSFDEGALLLIPDGRGRLGSRLWHIRCPDAVTRRRRIPLRVEAKTKDEPSTRDHAPLTLPSARCHTASTNCTLQSTPLGITETSDRPWPRRFNHHESHH